MEPFSDSGTFVVTQREAPFPSAAAPHPASGLGAATGSPGCPTPEPGCGRWPRRTFRLPSRCGPGGRGGFSVQPLSGAPQAQRPCPTSHGAARRGEGARPAPQQFPAVRAASRPVSCAGSRGPRSEGLRPVRCPAVTSLHPSPDPAALPSFPHCTAARGFRDGHPFLPQAGPRDAASPPHPHLNTGDRDTGRESPRPLRGSQRLCGPLSWGAWPSQGAHARGKELEWGPCGPGLRSRCCRCLVLGLPRRHRGLQSLSAPSAKRATKLARE